MWPRKKPHSDKDKPKGPQHDFPAAWYGNVACQRCHRAIEDITMTGAPCVSDEAVKLSEVVGRLRRATA